MNSISYHFRRGIEGQAISLVRTSILTPYFPHDAFFTSVFQTVFVHSCKHCCWNIPYLNTNSLAYINQSCVEDIFLPWRARDAVALGFQLRWCLVESLASVIGSILLLLWRCRTRRWWETKWPRVVSTYVQFYVLPLNNISQ